MVLKSKNGKPKARVSSNAQNIPPRTSSSRFLAYRLRNIGEAARRHNLTRSTEYTPASFQKGKQRALVSDGNLCFPVSNPVPDVAMSQPNQRVTISRELRRPEFEPIDLKRIVEINDELTDVPLNVLSMQLELRSPEFLLSLASVTLNQEKGVVHCLPNEVPVTLSDSTLICPSHILAVTSTAASSDRRKVDLYPVHSLILATQCAKMMPFPPSPTIEAGQQAVKLPIVTIAIPHPESFRPLLLFLYSKNPAKLAKDLMPLAPPPKLFEDHSLIPGYAARLAKTFTEGALLRFAAHIFGLWKNVCAFSIDNRTLWTAMDILWDIYILALTSKVPTGRLAFVGAST